MQRPLCTWIDRIEVGLVLHQYLPSIITAINAVHHMRKKAHAHLPKPASSCFRLQPPSALCGPLDSPGPPESANESSEHHRFVLCFVRSITWNCPDCSSWRRRPSLSVWFEQKDTALFNVRFRTTNAPQADIPFPTANLPPIPHQLPHFYLPTVIHTA